MTTLTPLELAKTMFVFDEKHESEVDYALPLATRELRKRLLAPAFMNYMNKADEQNILSIANSVTPGQIVISVADANNVSIYDMIVISSTANYNNYYEIVSVDYIANTFEVAAIFVIDEPGVLTNETLETIKTAHAWLILHFATFTLQKLEKGKVLVSSVEFGEGKVKTYSQEELNELRERYIRNAEMLIGKVNG